MGPLLKSALILSLSGAAHAAAQPAPLDRSLEPEPVRSEDLLRVYDDVISVQRKAREKRDRFTFGTGLSFDFNDGPTTKYGVSLALGYALTEELEIALVGIPFFVARERDFVAATAGLRLQDGTSARVRYSRPRAQYGAEFIWAPAYGKDSWGPRRIVRSDTFLKFGASLLSYESSNGGRYTLTIGKTFFLSRFFNLRFAAGGGAVETPINGTVNTYVESILETGAVWYL